MIDSKSVLVYAFIFSSEIPTSFPEEAVKSLNGQSKLDAKLANSNGLYTSHVYPLFTKRTIVCSYKLYILYSPHTHKLRFHSLLLFQDGEPDADSGIDTLSYRASLVTTEDSMYLEKSVFYCNTADPAPRGNPKSTSPPHDTSSKFASAFSKVFALSLSNCQVLVASSQPKRLRLVFLENNPHP